MCSVSFGMELTSATTILELFRDGCVEEALETVQSTEIISAHDIANLNGIEPYLPLFSDVARFQISSDKWKAARKHFSRDPIVRQVFAEGCESLIANWKHFMKCPPDQVNMVQICNKLNELQIGLSNIRLISGPSVALDKGYKNDDVKALLNFQASLTVKLEYNARLIEYTRRPKNGIDGSLRLTHWLYERDALMRRLGCIKYMLEYIAGWQQASDAFGDPSLAEKVQNLNIGTSKLDQQLARIWARQRCTERSGPGEIQRRRRLLAEAAARRQIAACRTRVANEQRAAPVSSEPRFNMLFDLAHAENPHIAVPEIQRPVAPVAAVRHIRPVVAEGVPNNQPIHRRSVGHPIELGAQIIAQQPVVTRPQIQAEGHAEN